MAGREAWYFAAVAFLIVAAQAYYTLYKRSIIFSAEEMMAGSFAALRRDERNRCVQICACGFAAALGGSEAAPVR